MFVEPAHQSPLLTAFRGHIGIETTSAYSSGEGLDGCLHLLLPGKLASSLSPEYPADTDAPIVTGRNVGDNLLHERHVEYALSTSWGL